MRKLNCPNCGAPIAETKCPYCGTVFYDFTVIDNERPTYIMMNWHGKQVAFRALLTSAEIHMEYVEYPLYGDEAILTKEFREEAEANLEFRIMPDDKGVLMKKMEIRKYEDG